MSAAADVVVIGAGIVGAACAYFLSEAGLRVTLVDRDFPASGTSRACDGLILLWDKVSSVELDLGKASARLWIELADVHDLDCEYNRCGSILVAENAEALSAGTLKAAELQAASVRAEVLDRPGLQALEPRLAPDLAGGVFFPDDAQIDARRATVAFVTAAKRKGLTLCRDALVTAIRRDADGRLSAVVTRDTEIPCRAVVCAAGVWSNEVTGLLGVDLPVRPRKGQILVTAGVPGMINHPLLEGGYVSAVQSTATDVPQVALVAEQTAAGTLLLGSSREFVGFDRDASTPRAPGNSRSRRSFPAGSAPYQHYPQLCRLAALEPGPPATDRSCRRHPWILCRHGPRGRRHRAGADHRPTHNELDYRQRVAGLRTQGAA